MRTAGLTRSAFENLVRGRDVPYTELCTAEVFVKAVLRRPTLPSERRRLRVTGRRVSGNGALRAHVVEVWREGDPPRRRAPTTPSAI